MNIAQKSIKIQLVTSVEDIWSCASLLDGDIRKLIDYSLGPAFRGCGYVVCAKVEDKIVGAVWGVYCIDRDTLYIPYIAINSAGRGLGLYAPLCVKLCDIAKADGFRYAFGLTDPDNYASIKGLQRAGFQLVHSGKKFYYPDAKGCFYFIDLHDHSRKKPPSTSRFWRNVMSMEALSDV